MLPGITGVRPPGILPEMVVADKDIEQSVKNSDLALITIGRNSGEGEDRKLETNYRLTQAEKQQIATIAKTFHKNGKKVVVVLNVGSAIEMDSWENDVDAILLAWQPGQEAGFAVADVLSGKVNPSGKLPDTFFKKYSDVPSADNFPGTPKDKPEQVIYKEGIYVGYRYADTFNVNPAYAFGYGLSYTDFSITDLKLSSKIFKNSIIATAKVTNTGKVVGKQVIQLYISAPSNDR